MVYFINLFLENKFKKDLFKRNKILVIGASGYLGNRLFNESLDQFIVEGTSTEGKKFHKLNLLKPYEFDNSIIREGNFVFFTPAISSPDECKNDSKDSLAWRTNIIGTKIFIEDCLKKKAKVIFFSSDTIYGETTEMVNENSKENPFGNYSKMKRIIEKEFECYEDFKSIRLSYVFSKHDKFSKYLFNCANKKINAEVFPSMKRAVIYINDVIDGLKELIKGWDKFKEYKVINFGGPEILSREDLAKLLGEKAIPSLNYKVIPPPEDFFIHRPKEILMESPILNLILHRKLTYIKDAIIKEF